MSYTINKTDGTTLTEIVDGTIDQTATDLTLLGKNSNSYGEFLNENFIYLLENFANTSSPNHPLTGQLWFDTTEGRLKVYDGNGFKAATGTIVQDTVPILSQGEIWIDSFKQQMYFNDGSSNLLAGPLYTAQQGMTGFNVIDVLDTNSLNHTIILLYVAQTLLGIFSKDAFTPLSPIAGFTGSISVGFNASTLSDIKFKVASSESSSLIAADGSLRTAESFLSSIEDSYTTGSLSILNNTPLILGAGSQSEVNISDSLLQLMSNVTNQNFEVNLKNSSGSTPSLFIDAANKYIGVYTNTPSATLDVNGDVIVEGNLTVKGSYSVSIDVTNINNGSLTGNTSFPGGGHIDSNGHIGIGMVPNNVLDITQNQNNQATIKVLNNNIGLAAGSTLLLSNGSNNSQVSMWGTGGVPSGMRRPDGLQIYSGGTGGLTLNTGTAQPIYFGVGNTEVARFDSVGDFSVTGSVYGPGADYAEYEKRRDDCGNINKGQIVGRDINGLLTDKWSLSVTFGIKSTNPYMVGGTTWDENHEIVRDDVDWIAKCGRVPCNVSEGSPGDYLVPVQGDNDTISVLVVSQNNLTLLQYIKSVAFIRRTLDGNRREVEVKVG